MANMYPTFSVVDHTPEGAAEGTVVVWQVQSAPDAAADALSGAWVLGEPGGLGTDRLADIVHGTVLVPTDVSFLAQIADTMAAKVKDYKAAAKQAKQDNPQLTLPSFEAIAFPQVDAIQETYHGDPVAAVAWSHATALLSLIEQWNAIESQRKNRKYLHKDFGADVQPLPVAT